MPNSLQTNNSCNINIGGIILKITSERMDILSFIIRKYGLFIDRGNLESCYHLNITISKFSQAKFESNQDRHPEVVYHDTRLILNFPASTMAFDLVSRSGVFITQKNGFDLEFEYTLKSCMLILLTWKVVYLSMELG